MRKTEGEAGEEEAGEVGGAPATRGGRTAGAASPAGGFGRGGGEAMMVPRWPVMAAASPGSERRGGVGRSGRRAGGAARRRRRRGAVETKLAGRARGGLRRAAWWEVAGVPRGATGVGGGERPARRRTSPATEERILGLGCEMARNFEGEDLFIGRRS